LRSGDFPARLLAPLQRRVKDQRVMIGVGAGGGALLSAQ
jgi:hypothetical protein